MYFLLEKLGFSACHVVLRRVKLATCNPIELSATSQNHNLTKTVWEETNVAVRLPKVPSITKSNTKYPKDIESMHFLKYLFEKHQIS